MQPLSSNSSNAQHLDSPISKNLESQSVHDGLSAVTGKRGSFFDDVKKGLNAPSKKIDVPAKKGKSSTVAPGKKT
jgi:hypothetical protein